MLHIVSQTLADAAVLQRFAPGDAVLFTRNAVFGLLQRGRWAGELLRLQGQTRLYVLQPDIELRGIELDSLVPGIEAVDYPGFVALTVEHPVNYSWS